MSDIMERVVGEQDFFKKLLSKIPGFKGYIARNHRRSADKLLRETIADGFESQWARISAVQRDLVNQGGLEYVDDLENAAIKLRQFIDRIKKAAYGYAGLFDPIKINEEELNQIYQYDLALVSSIDEVGRAVDNIEASIGSDGLPAAIRNLTALSQSCVEAFNRRSEVILDVVAEVSGNQPTLPPLPPDQPSSK
jgi:hypothetical protein